MRPCSLSSKVLTIVLAVLIVSVSSCFGESTVAVPIKFLTHSVGDQTYLDNPGHLRGKKNGGRRAFNVELVREMMLMMDQDTVFEVVPFKRGLQMVQSTPGYALFNINRTEERESTVQWLGPLQSSVTHFYENKNAPTGVKSLEETKNVGTICVLRGNVHHRFLEKQGFKNIYPANSYVNCVEMLALKRVSITPISNLSSLLRIDRNPDARLLQKTPVEVMESKGYLAFSKETPSEVVKAWQLVLDGLVESGRYDELVEEYLVNETE
jgi:polar amino acid transport system substrate-binding protein